MEIVTEPFLILPFAMFAVVLPVVLLHFYLVFPRTNPVLARHRRRVLGWLYGVPAAYLAAIWRMILSGRSGFRDHRRARTWSWPCSG